MLAGKLVFSHGHIERYPEIIDFDVTATNHLIIDSAVQTKNQTGELSVSRCKGSRESFVSAPLIPGTMFSDPYPFHDCTSFQHSISHRTFANILEPLLLEPPVNSSLSDGKLYRAAMAACSTSKWTPEPEPRPPGNTSVRMARSSPSSILAPTSSSPGPESVPARPPAPTSPPPRRPLPDAPGESDLAERLPPHSASTAAASAPGAAAAAAAAGEAACFLLSLLEESKGLAAAAEMTPPPPTPTPAAGGTGEDDPFHADWPHW